MRPLRLVWALPALFAPLALVFPWAAVPHHLGVAAADGRFFLSWPRARHVARAGDRPSPVTLQPPAPMPSFAVMANETANPGTETEQPGIYPGKTGPELPGRPKTEPELPTRRGNPERELPNLPREPEREIPRVPPSTPEAPPMQTPQHDAPPVMT